MRQLSKANEDYLEAILILEKKGEKIRSVKIAQMLKVSKPGVNKAMNVLKENGWIEKSDYSDITLTKTGREIANKVYEKHLIIREFLIKIGVSPETAENDCCLIEHAISEETFDQIVKELKK